jgi:GAF domain-containing protein
MLFAPIRTLAVAPAIRRRGRRHDLDLRRGIPVLMFGLLGLFVISAMAIGYVQGSARTPLGVARQLSSGHLVEMDSRMLAGGDYQLVSVTRAGVLQGFRPGQMIGMTGWTLSEKLAFAYPTPRSLAGGAALRLHQGLPEVVWTDATNRLSRDNFIQHGLDILVRIALLCSSLCILQFANGRAAMCAGLYLGFSAVANSPVATFAGLPEIVQVVGLTVAALGRPAAYIARLAFVMTLFPGSGRLKRSLWVGFGILLAGVCTLMGGQLATILFNVPIVPVSPFLLPILQCATQLASLVLFGVAAWRAEGASRFVLRVIFASTFVTLFSYIVQEAYLIAGEVPPGWMFWYFDTALLGAGIGYPWAIFARRIAGVDFIISRSVAYAVSVALIFCLIELTESLFDNLSGDWRTNEILIYGIPLAVTLSMSWLQTQMTTLVGFLLDGDLRHLERTLRSLQERLPTLPDLWALSETVTQHVAAALHMERATLYGRGEDGVFRMLTQPGCALAADDPALENLRDGEPVELDETGSKLQGGLLFPLIVFGHLVGLLHCGARPHDKGYDRVERQMLSHLAKEIAVALVWLDPRLRVPRNLL